MVKPAVVLTIALMLGGCGSTHERDQHSEASCEAPLQVLRAETTPPSERRTPRTFVVLVNVSSLADCAPMLSPAAKSEYWGSTGERPPRTFVAELAILVNGERAPMPPSAWAGLGDPGDVRMSFDDSGDFFSVFLQETARKPPFRPWVAQFVFNSGGYLQKKRVGTFPDEFEETIYRHHIPSSVDDGK